MKIQSKSPFLNFSDTISLLNNNKLTKVKDFMNKWEEESVSRAKSKISEYPIFTKEPIVQAIDNLETVKQVVESLSCRVQQTLKAKADKYNIPYGDKIDWTKLFGKITRHEKGLETCAKADKYNIPYNEENIDLMDLSDKVARWEQLITQAKGCNLKVDVSNYDPFELEDRIEEEVSSARIEKRDLFLDYYSSRL